jgi:hypothetical protein
VCALGSLFAIVLVKQLFGGIGKNFANPALAARAFLFLTFSSAFVTSQAIGLGFEASTGATWLSGKVETTGDVLLRLFIGNTGSGAVGETCVIAILIGYIYLSVRKVIDFRIPLMIVGWSALFALLFDGLIVKGLGGLDLIYNTLAQFGYAVKYKVLDSSEYGNVPQHRNRIFIVAFLDYDQCARFSFPEPIERTVQLNDILDRTVKHHDIYYYNASSFYYDEMLKTVMDKRALYKINDHGVSPRKHFICPTLTANMGTYPDRVPIIKDDYGIRKITPLECLALQGFPKDFIFKGISLNSAYKQCGNSVVVPVIKRIAEKIKESYKN